MQLTLNVNRHTIHQQLPSNGNELSMIITHAGHHVALLAQYQMALEFSIMPSLTY